MAMTSGKKTVLALIGVFTAPIVLGSAMFLNADRLGLDVETTNYGTLVQPPVNLSTTDVLINQAPAEPEQFIRNKWTLLYITPDKCEVACQERQALMKRIRLLTNEDMRRLQTASVYPDTPTDTIRLSSNYSNMTIAVSKANSEFIRQFPKQAEHPIYLVDPLGNLMMYFTGDSPDIKRIMKDFKRILKYSRIG